VIIVINMDLKASDHNLLDSPVTLRLLELFQEKTFWTGILAIPVVYILIVIIKWIQSTRRKNELLLKHFGSLERHWLFGSYHTMKGAGPEFFHDLRGRAAKYKHGWVSWLGYFVSGLQVCHPETMKIVLKRTDPKPLLYKQTLLEWIGEGLILKSGRKWYRNRRLLTPAFHFDILRAYVPIYNEAVDIFMQKLEDGKTPASGFDLFDEMSLLTLDVILQCAFSQESDCQRKPCTYIDAVKDFSVLWAKLVASPYYFVHHMFPWAYGLTASGKRFYKLCDIVDKEAKIIIEDRQDLIKSQDRDAYLSGRRYVDFLDILLLAQDEDGVGLSKPDILSEVQTFLFAGHDTTSGGLSWTLYLMATHPEHQQRVQQELDNVLAGRDNQHIRWEDLAKLSYLAQCLKESLRMYPPVPIVSRQLEEEIDILGCPVPAGTNVGLHIYALHHNVHVWGEDHMQFKPERFEIDKVKDRDAYAFVPFSAGPRNCIGQNFALTEEKVILARLLHRYTFTLTEDSPAPEMAFRIILRPQNKVFLKATPRA